MLTWFRKHIKDYRFNMEKLYQVAGITRQGYHKKRKTQESEAHLFSHLKHAVLELREDHPRMGARKLYLLLNLEGIIGINKFENFLSQEGLGIKHKKSPYITTNSNHVFYKYSNLLYGIKLTGVNQVWGSDITYFIINESVYYIVFIEDLYSRKILGYSANNNMLHDNNMEVLSNSIKMRKGEDLGNLIHHSDKGGQFCSTNYINLLNKHGIKISMANNSLENPYVERLNGILKNDYLYPGNRVKDLKSLRKELDTVVVLYNEVRPHSQLGGMAPAQFERQIKNIQIEDREPLLLYDFASQKHKANAGFFEASTKRMSKDCNKKGKPEVNADMPHSHRTSYSSESCSPAELSSASLDNANIKLSEN